MKITVLTYDHVHRKTYDVIMRLLALGYRPDVIGVPWEMRKPRDMIYAHRPSEPRWPCFSPLTPRDLCENLGLNYEVQHTIGGAPGADLVIVGGAGILPAAFVNTYKVLNIHPGLLPARRGLDVLKWAIIDCAPVGVTAHLCDEETDLGYLLIEEPVRVYYSDTFHAFAMRQYEEELNLLAPSIRLALSQSKSDLTPIRASESVAYRRMPSKIEANLLEAFERYKLVFACR